MRRMFKYLINTEPYAYVASDMITRDRPLVVMWSRMRYTPRELAGLVSSIAICMSRGKKIRINLVPHEDIIDALITQFNFKRG